MLRKSDVATPEVAADILKAFEAGQKAERDRILSAIAKIEHNEVATKELGKLVWTKKLVKELGLEK